MMNALEVSNPLRWFVPTSNTEYIRLEHGQPEDRLIVTEDDSETKTGLLLESPFGITLDDCVQARREYERDFCRDHRVQLLHNLVYEHRQTNRDQRLRSMEQNLQVQMVATSAEALVFGYGVGYEHIQAHYPEEQPEFQKVVKHLAGTLLNNSDRYPRKFITRAFKERVRRFVTEESFLWLACTKAVGGSQQATANISTLDKMRRKIYEETKIWKKYHQAWAHVTAWENWSFPNRATTPLHSFRKELHWLEDHFHDLDTFSWYEKPRWIYSLISPKGRFIGTVLRMPGKEKDLYHRPVTGHQDKILVVEHKAFVESRDLPALATPN